MNFFFTTEIILFFTVFVFRIRTSMGISIHQYKRLEYMNDKIISGQNSLFTRKGSLIKCVKDCALIPNCVSVFYSKLVCKGYPVVYQPSSPNLISMQGIRYYACVEIYSGFSMTSSTDIFVQNSTTQISTINSNQESITTDVTTKESSAETTSKTTTNISVQDSTTQISTDDSSQNTVITDVTTKESSPETTSQLPISTVDTSSPLYSTTLMTTTSLQSSCSIAGALGYSWDSIYSICYKFNATELNAVESKAKCQSDYPNSRLLLVDSDNAYNFAVHIVVTNSIESIYLQGIRSGTEFVDDHGKVITYFRWNDGEPGSGEHLQTERDSRLQEASSGGTPHPVLCRFYG
ncbi:uncharacterized protein LOC128164391 [Crassostrea angulata]|uniref:uncharacterized protein LOC128164391 n=1 Tax=Magallana angulata TaxID=2784310 RepID=UPI0022B092B9|nr:uncharacterized protein LOC128164391 [Crassostrea angulata]